MLYETLLLRTHSSESTIISESQIYFSHCYYIKKILITVMDVIRSHYCLNNYCVELFLYLLLSLLDCLQLLPDPLNGSFNRHRRGRSRRRTQNFFSWPCLNSSSCKRVMSYATKHRCISRSFLETYEIQNLILYYGWQMASVSS